MGPVFTRVAPSLPLGHTMQAALLVLALPLLTVAAPDHLPIHQQAYSYHQIQPVVHAAPVYTYAQPTPAPDVCSTVNETVCENVPVEQCNLTPKEVCVSVMESTCLEEEETRCTAVKSQECNTADVQACTTINTQECVTVTNNVCTNVTETLCSPITKTVSDYTFEDKTETGCTNINQPICTPQKEEECVTKEIEVEKCETVYDEECKKVP